MIPIGYAILITFIHWVADFVFQTHEMSINKSKSIKWLTYHIAAYTLITTMGWVAFTLSPITLCLVAMFTFVSHWLTDFVTSKITAYLYAKGDIHNFFVVIGFDQVIHATTLFLTYLYLIS